MAKKSTGSEMKPLEGHEEPMTYPGFRKGTYIQIGTSVPLGSETSVNVKTGKDQLGEN